MPDEASHTITITQSGLVELGVWIDSMKTWISAASICLATEAK